MNIDYVTAVHLDAKNVAGSYSALLVLETGDQPHAGGFYLLPGYHMALDVRQGNILFHRSGDLEARALPRRSPPGRGGPLQRRRARWCRGVFASPLRRRWGCTRTAGCIGRRRTATG